MTSGARSADGSAADAVGDPSAYPPIRDLAAIGDGRSVAVLSKGGSVVWWSVPATDSPSAFGSLLDARTGGSFDLAPIDPFTVRRRYVPNTNVIETTFETDAGIARVTDALTLPIGGGLIPFRELVRRIEGVIGTVVFTWSVAPRFGYGVRRTRISRRSGVPIAASGDAAVAVGCWNAGPPATDATTITGSFETSPGSRSLISLSAAHQEPLVLPARDEVERRLDATVSWWRSE